MTDLNSTRIPDIILQLSKRHLDLENKKKINNFLKKNVRCQLRGFYGCPSCKVLQLYLKTFILSPIPTKMFSFSLSRHKEI